MTYRARPLDGSHLPVAELMVSLEQRRAKGSELDTMDAYKPPGSEVNDPSSESERVQLGYLLLIWFGCYVGVSYLSSFLNAQYLHVLVPENARFYWDVRLVSDLLQCTLYLGLGGYLLTKVSGRFHWLICGIFIVVFAANTIRIVGFTHIFLETCSRHWYDVLVLLKTPVALVAGVALALRARRTPAYDAE